MASDPRIHVGFRTAPKAREMLDDLAHEHRVDRSEVIRAALSVAFRHKEEIVAVLKGRL